MSRRYLPKSHSWMARQATIACFVATKVLGVAAGDRITADLLFSTHNAQQTYLFVTLTRRDDQPRGAFSNSAARRSACAMARSASTMMRTSSRKVTRGLHP